MLYYNCSCAWLSESGGVFTTTSPVSDCLKVVVCFTTIFPVPESKWWCAWLQCSCACLKVVVCLLQCSCACLKVVVCLTAMFLCLSESGGVPYCNVPVPDWKWWCALLQCSCAWLKVVVCLTAMFLCLTESDGVPSYKCSCAQCPLTESGVPNEFVPVPAWKWCCAWTKRRCS